jgi:hypothetical protein
MAIFQGTHPPPAPDDLRLGHRTQEWLAASDYPEALASAAATGTTSTGKSRITPSAMSGSRTNS